MLTQADGITPEYVAIGEGNLDDLGNELGHRSVPVTTAFLIGDRVVDAIYGERAAASLEAAGWRVRRRVIAAGEASKSLAVAADLWQWLLAERAERADLLVALGGGVIGDLVGFVAATWARGVAWAQVATTLLAQVDSSIGGKVAIDLIDGKNMVGAFHNPVLSLLDISTLQSLPQRELAAGWAEAIKHGLIRDDTYLAELERDLRDLRDPAMLDLAVRSSVRIKTEVVVNDPFDRGLRAVLNYGHTVGHAIEALGNYRRLRHGEAVAIGMAAAGAISVQVTGIDPAAIERQNALLGRCGLGLSADGFAGDDILCALRTDKKTAGGQARWVLLERAGEASAGHVVDCGIVAEALAKIGAGPVGP